MRSIRTIRRLASASALLLLCGVQAARADSVGQVQTTKYFAPETVAMLKQRVTDVANGVPGATLGFKQGDTVSYIIQFTPIANNSNIGAGGYITDYIPPGTQVTGAWFVQPDGAGGFYRTSPPAPAQMANGFGNGGAGAYTAGWTSDAYTISTCTAAGRTLANCTGNLAQLYADTGIFYSTDARTAVFSDPGTDGRVQQWSAPTGNGYNICPTRGSQLVPLMGGVVTGCAAGGASTHNYWDAAMTSAFGTTAAFLTTLTGLPRSAGIAAIDTDGSMVPPFNAGSPVAGPDSGYQLDYTGAVGPWQRVSYAGSMMGSNAFAPTTNPATVMGTNTVLATPTFSGAGFPLPASTNAVRWAAGRLVVGTQNYVKISLLLTAPPPSVGLVNNSEVFGGDTSPESSSGAGGGAGFGNRDSAWVYHVPSVASNVSTLYILKEVVCVYDATGTCVANNGANLPTTGTPATLGPKVRYRISYINSNNGTQHNVTICDQLPATATAINFASAVTQVSAIPNIGAPASPAAAACGFGAGGTTFSYPVMPVIAGGGAGILEYDVQLPLLTAGTSIVNTAKAASTEIPAGVTSYTPSNVVTSVAANLLISKTVSSSTPGKGDTLTYAISISNTGSTAASLTTLVDTLPGAPTAVVANQAPSRFNYAATDSITVNGAPLSGVTTLVTPPALPATTNSETVTWTFPSGMTIPAGGQMVVTFTATAGGTLASNTMLYGTAYSNTATINCAAACVVAPVAPNTATSKTTGLTAVATLTAPGLQLSKTIDCVFDLGVCTPGSYVTGSAIPLNAQLRYKIVYANPGASAQTITLTDALPTQVAANAISNMTVDGVAAAAPTNAAGGGTVTLLNAVSLASGGSGTVSMDVQTNAAAAAVVTNTASLQSVERAAAGGVAVTSAATATAAALTVSKVASVNTIGSGGTVNYAITVTNNSAAAVSITRITDTLPTPTPAGSTIQCGTSAATCLATATLNGAPVVMPAVGTWTATSVRWNTAISVPAGGVFVLTFPVTFSPTVTPGTYLNRTVQVRTAAGTTTLSNSAPVTVQPNTISVSKAVVAPASASIEPNSPVTYAITVSNTGSNPVPITSVVDSLPAAAAGTIAYASTTSVLVNGVAQAGVAGVPAGAQYANPAPAAAVAGTQQAVTWAFPAAGTTVINPGQTMVITFVAQYGAVPPGAAYLNDVRVNYTGGAAASEAGNNLAPVTVVPVSRITKTIDCVYAGAICTPGTYVDGTPIPVNAKLGYKIAYENLSLAPASGITISDILPAQTAANSISNLVVNGVATAAPASAAGGATVTLLSGGTLTAFNSAGSTGTITFDVQTTATAGAGVTNTGKMVSAQDPLGVTSLATAAAAGGNLTVSKAVTANTSSTVAQGGSVSYTITVSNSGSAAATLNSLADTLPGTPAVAPGTTSRFTYAATSAITLNGAAVAPVYTAAVTAPAAPATSNRETVTWTFTGGVVIPAGQSLTLTFSATVGTAVSKGAAAPGATYYNDVTANYTGGAFPSASATGQAPVLVPFYTLTMNKTIDCVYDAAAVCQPYTGTPIPPGAKVRYRLAYGNIAMAAQTVTVKDTLPTQVAANAISNMTLNGVAVVAPANAAGGGTVILQNAVSLAAGSDATILMDVQTNAAAAASVSNCASISTVAADTCATVGVVKSTATAGVQNVAVLSMGKTTSTSNVVAGGTATYTITITNTGNAATTSLKVYDFLPYSGTAVDAGKRLAYVANSSTYSGGLPVPAITTSVAPTVLPYASNMNQQQVLWDFGNYALAAGATVSITFNATVGAAMPGVSYYNSARYEYTSAGISFNANVNNAALITVGNVQPSLTLLKTVAVLSDPLNGTTDPKFIPGALASYTLVATNSGTGSVDNDSLVITDPLPANTALFVNDIGAAGSGPVLFSQGATSSTLTYTFTALNDGADDVAFSNDNAATWTYVPAPGADGCDPLVTHLRINPKGTFVGNPAAPSPSFNLNFRACVK